MVELFLRGAYIRIYTVAAESRVCSHYRFVRSSPDSGGGSSNLPLDLQYQGSAIFYVLDRIVSPRTFRLLLAQACRGPCQHSTFMLWADFKVQGSRGACMCVMERGDGSPGQV